MSTTKRSTASVSSGDSIGGDGPRATEPTSVLMMSALSVRVVVEDDDVAGDGRAIDQASRLAVEHMGEAEVEPDRSLAGEDDVVAVSGEADCLTLVVGQVREPGVVVEHGADVDLDHQPASGRSAS